MNEAAALTFAAAVPFLLLGLLLWLARLEETLGDGLTPRVADPALTVDADAVPPIPTQPVAQSVSQSVSQPVATAAA